VYHREQPLAPASRPSDEWGMQPRLQSLKIVSGAIEDSLQNCRLQPAEAAYWALDGRPAYLLSEFLGTAVLLFEVRALTERGNSPPGVNLSPVLVEAAVWSIGLSPGGLTG
jgi:glycerol uptake facilitator-like aquaporin